MPGPDQNPELPKPETAPAASPKLDNKPVGQSTEKTAQDKQDVLSEGEQQQVKDFQKDIEAKADSEKARLNKLESEKVMPTDMLSERAGKRMHDLFAKQRAEIDALVKGAKDDLLEEKQETHGKLEDLIKQLKDDKTEKAKEEADVFTETILRLMKDKTGTMTTEDVAAVERALVGAEKSLIDAELEPLIKKISKGQRLTEPEIGTIISKMNVDDINAKRASFEEGFEATSAGALIALMKPEEKVHLVEVFMDSEKKGQTVQLLEAFMGTGVLSLNQVQRTEGVPLSGSKQSLFDLAISKHVPTEYGPLTDEIYEKYYKPKFDNGTYNQMYDNFMKLMRSEEGRRIGGSFSRNAFWDMVQTPSGGFMGSPVCGLLLSIWGGTVFTLNAMANHDDLASLATNPSAIIGLAAGVYGIGALKSGARIDGSPTDWIREWKEYLKNPKSVAEKLDDKNKIKIAETYKQSPPQMRNYLDRGGYESLYAIYKDKKQKGQKYPDNQFTIQELMDFEKSNKGKSERLHVLEEISKLDKSAQTDILQKLTFTAELASHLDYKDESARVPGMAILLKDIKEKGVPTEGSAGNPTSGPKPKPVEEKPKQPEAPKTNPGSTK